MITRIVKDLVCRYKTMKGYQVLRKAGWDTHGLPVEIEVEKRLDIKSKDEIEKYGVAEFNRKCRESVFRYEKEWVRFTKRIGFWLDLDHPYVTCTNDYIESVWQILRKMWDARPDLPRAQDAAVLPALRHAAFEPRGLPGLRREGRSRRSTCASGSRRTRTPRSWSGPPRPGP